MHIANVSAQTSGLYRCSVTNLLGTQHCYINLSVYTRESLCMQVWNDMGVSKLQMIVVFCELVAPDNSPGILQGVMLSLSMALLLLALMVLVLWLHRSAQESKWRNSHEEDECYNEIKYTPSLIKRSFVWDKDRKWHLDHLCTNILWRPVCVKGENIGYIKHTFILFLIRINTKSFVGQCFLSA